MGNPTMLYKAPGPYDIHNSKLDYIIVDTDEFGALDAAHADGWKDSTPEALDAALAQLTGVQSPDSEAPPTREELEIQARQLGIVFNARTSNKKLRDLIAANLES